MKLETVKRKLKDLRAQQRILRKEIDKLRDAIRDAGEDPDAPHVDLVPRNKEMYRQWKSGKSFAEIARLFQLSPTRVYEVCIRIDKVLERKGGQYNKYKNLLKFRNAALKRKS